MTGMTQKVGDKSNSWRNRATVSVDEYAEILGISRQTAYASVQAGEVTVVRARGRILISVPALLAKLEGR